MTRRGGGGGGGFWGGAEPDLTRRPGSEGRTLRRIAGFFRPYRGRLAFIAVLILLTMLIVVLAITLMWAVGWLLHRRSKLVIGTVHTKEVTA